MHRPIFHVTTFETFLYYDKSERLPGIWINSENRMNPYFCLSSESDFDQTSHPSWNVSLGSLNTWKWRVEGNTVNFWANGVLVTSYTTYTNRYAYSSAFYYSPDDYDYSIN